VSCCAVRMDGWPQCESKFSETTLFDFSNLEHQQVHVKVCILYLFFNCELGLVCSWVGCGSAVVVMDVLCLSPTVTSVKIASG